MSHTTSAPVSTTPRSSGPATSVPCGCSSRALHSTVVSAHRTPVMSGGTVSSLRSPARIVNLGGRPETMGRSLMVSHDTGRSVADRPPAGSAPTLADCRDNPPSHPCSQEVPAEPGRSRRSAHRHHVGDVQHRRDPRTQLNELAVSNERQASTRLAVGDAELPAWRRRSSDLARCTPLLGDVRWWSTT